MGTKRVNRRRKDVSVSKIIELREKGMTWDEIAETLGIPRQTVQLHYDRYRQESQPGEDVKKENVDLLAEAIASDVLKGSLSNLFDKTILTPTHDYSKEKERESAILHLTDMHIGKRNEFYDITTGKAKETYNFEIFLQELKNLRKGITDIHSLLKNSYYIEKLHIFFTGDLIDNDRIYRGQQLQVDLDVGKQIWEAVGVLGQFINSLLEIYPEIECHCVVGNHGRTTDSKKTDELVTSNFEYHLYKALNLMFLNNSRIKFNIPDTKIMIAQIYDWKYLLMHGESIKFYSQVPFYSMIRSAFQYFATFIDQGAKVDSIFSGHIHIPIELSITENLSWITSSSWVPKDTFAFSLFKTFSPICQKFFGVNPKRKRTFSFDIDLRTGNIH